MLFKRRHRPGLAERIRVFLWPRRSWGRSTRYVLRRMRRLRGTPHEIAIGAAAGMFISFTPFLGFHFILAGLGAWILRGSILASALGTFVGNPLSFPFIWVSAYQMGNWMLGSEGKVSSLDELTEKLRALSGSIKSLSLGTLQTTLDSVWPLIKAMFIGGAPLGLLIAVLGYYIVRKTVETYQHRRAISRLRTAKATSEAVL